MARRLTLRRTLGLDRLESREVLSTYGAGPGPLEQLMLERINAARMGPAAVAQQYSDGLNDQDKQTAQYYGLDLNAVRQTIGGIAPQQPLAWSDELAGAARQHSQDMADKGFQSHTGSDGSDPGARANANGYSGSVAENAFAYAESVDNAMDAFMADWGTDGGHRRNLLQPGVPSDQSNREVGIGLVQSKGNGVGPLVVTQDFGRQANSNPYLLGVAYDDANNNHQYDLGEGQGGVSVDVTNLNTGRTQNVRTAPAGGWQVQVTPGPYRVTGRFDGHVVKSQDVTVSDQNQKLDFLTNSPPAAEPPPVVVVQGLGSPTPSQPAPSQGNPAPKQQAFSNQAGGSSSPTVTTVSVAPGGQADHTEPAPTATPPVFPDPVPVVTPPTQDPAPVVATTPPNTTPIVNDSPAPVATTDPAPTATAPTVEATTSGTADASPVLASLFGSDAVVLGVSSWSAGKS